MDLTGKQALVSGAGRGIGKGCALQLAHRGADLVVNDRLGSPDLEQTAEEIKALGRSCVVLRANVFSREECESLVEKAIQAAGRIDLLVSNPACSQSSSFLDKEPSDFDREIHGTLSSGFYLSQLVARHMIQRGGGGKIVFISSVHARMPYARSVAYNAAKAGLNQMAKTIAIELAAHRINVNVIEPGWIDTPKEHEIFGDEKIKEEASRLPWGRLGLPQDIGKAAAFLCSDEADYITGTVLLVDGGFVLKDCRADQLIPPLDKSC